jgi:hypothetical protein
MASRTGANRLGGVRSRNAQSFLSWTVCPHPSGQVFPRGPRIGHDKRIVIEKREAPGRAWLGQDRSGKVFSYHTSGHPQIRWLRWRLPHSARAVGHKAATRTARGERATRPTCPARPRLRARRLSRPTTPLSNRSSSPSPSCVRWMRQCDSATPADPRRAMQRTRSHPWTTRRLLTRIG